VPDGPVTTILLLAKEEGLRQPSLREARSGSGPDGELLSGEQFERVETLAEHGSAVDEVILHEDWNIGPPGGPVRW